MARRNNEEERVFFFSPGLQTMGKWAPIRLSFERRPALENGPFVQRQKGGDVEWVGEVVGRGGGSTAAERERETVFYQSAKRFITNAVTDFFSSRSAGLVAPKADKVTHGRPRGACTQ